jgi:hypothetical protein
VWNCFNFHTVHWTCSSRMEKNVVGIRGGSDKPAYFLCAYSNTIWHLFLARPAVLYLAPAHSVLPPPPSSPPCYHSRMGPQFFHGREKVCSLIEGSPLAISTEWASLALPSQWAGQLGEGERVWLTHSLRKHARPAEGVSRLSLRKRPSAFIATYHSGSYATRAGALSGASGFATFARR